MGQEDSVGEISVAQFTVARNGGDETDGEHKRWIHVRRRRVRLHTRCGDIRSARPILWATRFVKTVFSLDHRNL